VSNVILGVLCNAGGVGDGWVSVQELSKWLWDAGKDTWWGSTTAAARTTILHGLLQLCLPLVRPSAHFALDCFYVVCFFLQTFSTMDWSRYPTCTVILWIFCGSACASRHTSFVGTSYSAVASGNCC